MGTLPFTLRQLEYFDAIASGGSLAAAAERCHVSASALALALDISGSVDTSEYRLQMQGVANALRHPDVVAALMALPSAPVELAVFEWSGGDHQNLLIPWTAITSNGDLDRIAGTLFAARRGIAPPVTALGQAMSFGVDLLDQRQHCWKRTLDISGDGRNNSGPSRVTCAPCWSRTG